MPTFLELCQQFHEEVGTSGTIPSTQNQTGMLKREINWITKADRKVQLRKTNWNFLWSSWELTLTADDDYAPPSNLGQFDQTSFWIDAGTTEAYQLEFIDYKLWRDDYRHGYTDSGQPVFVAIKPNGRIAVLPAPSEEYQGKIITAEYWRAPVDLTNNSQVSLIPEQFHDIIVAQAKIYHAEYRHDNGAYAAALAEYRTLFELLKAHSLPGNYEDNKSESSIDMVVRVP